MRLAMIAIVMLVSASPGIAQQTEDAYFGRRELKPTEDEQEALQALATNRPRGPSGKPVVTADKSVRFVFGASLPVVVCAPLQICDVELQEGERVRSVQVGDAVRWSVEPAVTGVAPRETQHLIIKPADAGLRTSLVVTTDRRTYRIKLAADREKYMASVSFSYPEDALMTWTEFSERTSTQGAPPRKERAKSHARAKRAGSIRALSFNYELEGDDPPWKPARVYNDGLQTVIEMPFAMRQTEAPTLLVVRSEGGLFTDDDVVQVNFHVDGTKYIVDMVFDVADLIVGVGSTQQKVRIVRQ